MQFPLKQGKICAMPTTVLNPIVFEHPLNERIRLFLRLDRLFQHIDYHAQQHSVRDSQICIHLILELCELTNRGDLKTEVMKELERHQSSLKPLLDDPEIDHSRLSQLLNKQQQLLGAVYDSDGQLTTNIRNDEMLNGVQQRVCVPGGGCDFDLPLYHQWLQHPLNLRLTQFHAWIAPYEHVKEAIALCLEVMRLSANTQQIFAEQSFYDQILDTNHSLQLLRITLAPGQDCYPEVSAGKHRFSIRFFHMPNTQERPIQVKENINFSLSTCGL